MQSYFLTIYFAFATIITTSADVRHLSNQYLPPNREITALRRDYLPPVNAASASNQHNSYAPLKIVGEQSRFVSYVAPNSPVGAATYDVYTQSGAPASFAPAAAASIPVPAITTRHVSHARPRKPAVSAPKYYVRNSAPSQLAAAIARPYTRNQYESPAYSRPAQHTRQFASAPTGNNYVIYKAAVPAPRHSAAGTTRSLRHSAPAPIRQYYTAVRQAYTSPLRLVGSTVPKDHVYSPSSPFSYSRPTQITNYIVPSDSHYYQE